MAAQKLWESEGCEVKDGRGGAYLDGYSGTRIEFEAILRLGMEVPLPCFRSSWVRHTDSTEMILLDRRVRMKDRL